MRARSNSVAEKFQAAERYQRKVYSRIPLMAEVGSLYFAMIDPTVPLRKKARALVSPLRPIGYSMGGAMIGALTTPFTGPLGITSGFALGGIAGEAVNVYEDVVQPRHIEQAMDYFRADSGYKGQWEYGDQAKFKPVEKQAAKTVVVQQVKSRPEKPKPQKSWWSRWFGNEPRESKAAYGPEQYGPVPPEEWQSMLNGARGTHSRRNNATSGQAYISVLAHLRALQWAYWVTHWQVEGSASYGDHLLLERLYKGFETPIDQLGERLVGALGPRSVDHVKVGMQSILILQTHGTRLESEPFKTLLYLEGELGDTVKAAWRKANQDEDLGLDDFFMTLANDQKERVYLLKQRIDGTAWTKSQIAANALTNNAKPRQKAPQKVDGIPVRLGKKTRQGYLVHARVGGHWWELGHVKVASRAAVSRLIQASQITEIRANPWRR